MKNNTVAHNMHTNFTKNFPGRYLTSNAYIYVTDSQNKLQKVPIGCRSVLLYCNGPDFFNSGQGNMQSSKRGCEYNSSLDLLMLLKAEHKIAGADALQLLV